MWRSLENWISDNLLLIDHLLIFRYLQISITPVFYPLNL